MSGSFRCYKCEREWPLSEKCTNKMCKRCFSDYKKRRYREDPEHRARILRKTQEYRADNKERLREADVAWRRDNRDATAVRTSAWAKANPERRLESQQRRRARKRGGQVVRITQSMLSDRLSVFDGLCSYCGGLFEHWDHLKPLELGGPHILANLRPSCAPCNLRKGRMPAKEWLSLIFL